METEIPHITSVWSAYGHTFIGTGEYEQTDDGTVTGFYESCLTCGAQYVLRPTPDGISDGAYETNGGDEPMECSRDTGRVHGIERHCHDHDEPCEHTEHDCNCVSCD